MPPPGVDRSTPGKLLDLALQKLEELAGPSCLEFWTGKRVHYQTPVHSPDELRLQSDCRRRVSATPGLPLPPPLPPSCGDRLHRVTRRIVRYEHPHAGDLLHLDVKKLGRIPPGGGKRFTPGFAETGAGPSRGGAGVDALHIAIDDHSRYAYVESLPDERGPTAIVLA